MRSRLMENYFETNRSELEVRSDLCANILKSSSLHIHHVISLINMIQGKYHNSSGMEEYIGKKKDAQSRATKARNHHYSSRIPRI